MFTQNTHSLRNPHINHTWQRNQAQCLVLLGCSDCRIYTYHHQHDTRSHVSQWTSLWSESSSERKAHIPWGESHRGDRHGRGLLFPRVSKDVERKICSCVGPALYSSLQKYLEEGMGLLVFKSRPQSDLLGRRVIN